MKKALLFILVGTICVSFCGCGSNKNENTNGEVTKQATEETVKEEPKQELTKISVGDKITLDFAEITIDETDIKEDIQQSISNGSITYKTGPQAESGSKYAYIRGTIKNISKSEISNPTLSGLVDVDGYTYNTETSIIESSGKIAYGFAPLITYTYTIYAKLPNEIADQHNSCEFKMGFNDNFELQGEDEITNLKYGYSLNIK